jgi:hypothetical protein
VSTATLSIIISLCALGLSIFNLLYKEFGLKPNIERWPGSTKYPMEGSVKEMFVEFGVRNRRKHPVHILGATLQFSGVQLRGVKSLNDEKPGFTLGSHGDLEVAIRSEIAPGAALQFELKVDVDDASEDRPADVVLAGVRGERHGLRAPEISVRIREFSPREQRYVITG